MTLTTPAVLALLLAQMWVAVPLLGSQRLTPLLAMAAVLALCAWSNRRHGVGWGFRADALAPAARRAALLTLPAVAIILVAGKELGSLHSPGNLALRFAVLLLWALLQQFILQTVILREARGAMPRQAALITAAALFALVHLPNPLLTPVTFVAALGWCWVYDRHPNLLPIALSHAVASLALAAAFDPAITGGMRVGYGYFLHFGSWS
ncbi:MAG TPA: CPBP family intramembrane glutamic endopeptidase [Thermoanaerobaculia bacterium]|nr:CPBP family intramembrane glutamic endopeptidase [Thermoanaerobaculia bacterium]